MELQERSDLLDTIFGQQPNLVRSVLVLKEFGAASVQLEIALHGLMIASLAMNESGHRWPVVTEEDQATGLERITRHMKMHRSAPNDEARDEIEQYVRTHRERPLLAFLFKHLQDNGMLDVRTEAEKYVVLVTLNIGECIASV